MGFDHTEARAGPLELRVQGERVLVFYGHCNKLP